METSAEKSHSNVTAVCIALKLRDLEKNAIQFVWFAAKPPNKLFSREQTFWRLVCYCYLRLLEVFKI